MNCQYHGSYDETVGCAGCAKENPAPVTSAEFIGRLWEDKNGLVHIDMHDSGPSLVYGANALNFEDLVDDRFLDKTVRLTIEILPEPFVCPGCDQTDAEAWDSSTGHCRMCESVPTVAS
jgi:hypothetical protein